MENTYLSTFQALGGLGLILGSLGLAVVLLRSVWERRGELALLRALGFRRATLVWLVLAENGFLLLLGLAAGTVSALAGGGAASGPAGGGDAVAGVWPACWRRRSRWAWRSAPSRRRRRCGRRWSRRCGMNK